MSTKSTKLQFDTTVLWECRVKFTAKIKVDAININKQRHR